jgi:hypothetical protein
MMPPANSTIDIVVWASLGDTTLTVGQRLRLTGTQKYLDSQLNIMTDSAITGGSGMETTEETRNRAMYHVAYDDQVIWGGDYDQFLKDSIADITWLNIWGEAQQEKSMGKPDLDNINSIFICAHIPGLTQAQLEARITEALTGVPNELNKNSDTLLPTICPTPLKLKGRRIKTFNLATLKFQFVRCWKQSSAKTQRSKLAKTTGELFELAQNDIWAAVQTLQMMSKFTVTVVGLIPASKLNDFNYLDVEGSVIDVKYPQTL